MKLNLRHAISPLKGIPRLLVAGVLVYPPRLHASAQHISTSDGNLSSDTVKIAGGVPSILVDDKAGLADNLTAGAKVVPAPEGYAPNLVGRARDYLSQGTRSKVLALGRAKTSFLRQIGLYDYARFVETEVNEKVDPLTLQGYIPALGSDDKMIPFTKDKMRLVLRAAELAYLVYEEERAKAEGLYFTENSDGVDAYLTQTTDHYCFVSWRGSEAAWSDWMAQNFDLRAHNIDGCTVHRGFAKSFYGEGHYDENAEEFLEPILEYLRSPECEGKTTVLTGHSQGAAAAGVGHVYLHREFNPLTINFAQPPFLSAGCDSISRDRLWRFQNTDNYEGTFDNVIVYDLVPNVNYFPGSELAGTHEGAFAILAPGSPDVNYEGGIMSPEQTNFVYQGTANPDYDSLSAWNFDLTFTPHSMATHLRKIQWITTNLADSATCDRKGWVDDTWCSFDTECRTKNVDGFGGCVHGKCSGGQSGQSCDENAQCRSGSCNGVINGECNCNEETNAGCDWPQVCQDVHWDSWSNNECVPCEHGDPYCAEGSLWDTEEIYCSDCCYGFTRNWAGWAYCNSGSPP